jgi:tRNA dimethylallyltransferase
MPASPNTLVILGPTASGKTGLAVRLARAFGGEVVSADSRQVYRGLDIGSGKDLDEYIVDGDPVPYHLINIADLAHEFSVFDYQQAFYAAFDCLQGRRVLPVVCGGTGLYLEAVLKNYRMVAVPEQAELRAELEALADDALVARLAAARGALHNTTDTQDRSRAIRAIEIAEYTAQHEPEPAPEVRPLILGTRWERDVLRKRIQARLNARLDDGMVDEVEDLVSQGIPEARLQALGLEYRFISDFINGQIKNKNDLKQKLSAAIYQFARRQASWYRRMERRGSKIHWISEAEFGEAKSLVAEHFTGAPS